MSDSIALLALVAAIGWLMLLVVASVIRARQASSRAEKLLRRVLSPAELDQLNRLHYLDIPSRLYPYRTYRVPAREGTVDVLHNGVKAFGLCIRPAEQLPSREHVLAHKALLEAAEDDYLKRANVISGRLSP
jgi:hypothetical protein